MAIQTGLESKPWYVGAAVGFVIGAILVGVGYWQLLIPKYNEIKRLDKKVAELQVKIQEGRAAKAKLPQFREEVARLEIELEKLLRILPPRRNTQELLRRLRQLTEAGNFDLKRFTPGNFADREFFSEWPITVQLDGSYHNLALLFDRISRFSRIINVENLKLVTYRGARPHSLSANFVAKTFIYKEPAPPEANPAPAKKK